MADPFAFADQAQQQNGNNAPPDDNKNADVDAFNLDDSNAQDDSADPFADKPQQGADADGDSLGAELAAANADDAKPAVLEQNNDSKQDADPLGQVMELKVVEQKGPDEKKDSPALTYVQSPQYIILWSILLAVYIFYYCYCYFYCVLHQQFILPPFTTVCDTVLRCICYVLFAYLLCVCCVWGLLRSFLFGTYF